MSLHFFFVPALHPQPAQDELNAFLAAGHTLSISRDFAALPQAGWAICVERADGPATLPAGLKAGTTRGRGSGVDYKELLSDADFAVYAALRELRKQLAQAEGLPIFAVFTNEQLAAIVTGGVATKAALAEIAGIGPARIEKYADAVLGCLQAQRALQPGPRA